MFAKFLESAIPEPVTCLGVRLRPFSLGHYFLLSRFCPVVLSDESIAFTDLITAVTVCSGTYREGLDLFSGLVPDAEKRLAQWGKKIRKNKDFNSAISLNLFRLYLNRGRNFPVVKAEIKDAVKGPDPDMWPAVTLVTCMARLHQPFDQVMDQPLSQSRWLVAQWAETEGTVELVDAEDLAREQIEADRIAAEVEAEMKGGNNGRA